MRMARPPYFGRREESSAVLMANSGACDYGTGRCVGGSRITWTSIGAQEDPRWIDRIETGSVALLTATARDGFATSTLNDGFNTATGTDANGAPCGSTSTTGVGVTPACALATGVAPFTQIQTRHAAITVSTDFV